MAEEWFFTPTRLLLRLGTSGWIGARLGSVLDLIIGLVYLLFPLLGMPVLSESKLDFSNRPLLSANTCLNADWKAALGL